MTEQEQKPEKIYVVTGESEIEYEGSYFWNVCAYRSKMKAYEKRGILDEAAYKIEANYNYTRDKAEELREIDPACTGWGDKIPVYAVEELVIL